MGGLSPPNWFPPVLSAAFYSAFSERVGSACLPFALVYGLLQRGVIETRPHHPSPPGEGPSSRAEIFFSCEIGSLRPGVELLKGGKPSLTSLCVFSLPGRGRTRSGLNL